MTRRREDFREDQIRNEVPETASARVDEREDSDSSAEDDQIVVPVIDEEVDAGARAVKTGSVRVEKHVEKKVENIQMPLLREEVDVTRVPVNRVVAQAPGVRREGDTIIVPVVEEEVVVTKRLVLKEEIHLVKRRSKETFQKDVELNSESAEIRRLDAEGRIVDQSHEVPGGRQKRQTVQWTNDRPSLLKQKRH